MFGFKKAEVKKEFDVKEFMDRFGKSLEEVMINKVHNVIKDQFKDVDSVGFLQAEKLKLEKTIESLKRESNDLKEEIETAASANKMEKLELEHLIKMKNEKAELEFLKKEMSIKSEAEDRIYKIKEEYMNKSIDQLHTQADKINGIYTQILERLPNVNMAIKQNNQKQE